VDTWGQAQDNAHYSGRKTSKLYSCGRNGQSKLYHRAHPDELGQVQIKIKKLCEVDRRLIAYYADGSCRGIKGTGLDSIVTAPKMRELVKLPEIVSAACLSAGKWEEKQILLATQKELEKKQKEEERLRKVEYLAKQSLVRKEEYLAKQSLENEKRLARKLARDEEERKKRAAATLQAKKDECSSFGFKPETPDHAECVMKLAIAEKARNKSESQANALAEQSAAEARAYQAEIRRVQAQQEAANREAREAAKRQREAQLLINLGGAISSGQFPLGNSSEPAFSDEPMPSFDSGRYKECFYQVAGDRLSVSIPRAQGCPATRNFGSRVGYLTR